MENEQVRTKFGYPVDVLTRSSELILGTLKGELYGAQVAERMNPTFVPDFEAAVTALVKAVEDRSSAKGKVHTETGEQAKILAECMLYTGTAREIAKLTFSGQTAMLHEEFCVGGHSSERIATIIARADIVHTACVKYAEPLAANGWRAADTTKLATLIASLKEANSGRVSAAATQRGVTTSKANLANMVHKMCRLVQVAANIVYPEADASSNSTIIDARAQFLIGVFPPRESAPDDEATDPVGSGTAPGTPATPTAPSQP